MSEFGFSAKGTLQIFDGIFVENKIEIDPRFRNAAVRQDKIPDSEVAIQNLPKQNDIKSFEVDVSCARRASVYSEGLAVDTSIIIKKDTKYRRVAGKNLLKNIKDFICPLSGPKESSLVRKRLIGLQKIHKSLSNQVYNFKIDNP